MWKSNVRSGFDVRLLFAIVVTVAQVAGPWLCCCGPTRALAAPVASTPISSQSDDAPVCPRCAKRVAQTPAVAPSDAKPLPSGPAVPGGCPCCAVKLLDATATQPTRDADTVLTVYSLYPASLAVFDATAGVSVAVSFPSGQSDLPFLTTETRLHVHHALRC